MRAPSDTRLAARCGVHLAAVRERLVAALAVVADEDLVLHAHVLEAHALLVRAGPADLVRGQLAQLVDSLLRGGR